MKKLKLLEKSFKESLGDKEYEQLFEALNQEKDLRVEGREKLLSWLNDNPRDTKCRLLLARLYYIDGYAEFCVRELVELKKYTKLTSVDRLLSAFGDYALAFTRPNISNQEDLDSADDDEGEDEVVAELDLDMDFVAALDEFDDE